MYPILIRFPQGTPQFSAARVLDNPSKRITAADELECFFHVLLYYAVRFLRHNVPDKFVGLFLHNYFDASSGMTSMGQLNAPVFKRVAMKSGTIMLENTGSSTVSGPCGSTARNHLAESRTPTPRWQALQYPRRTTTTR